MSQSSFVIAKRLSGVVAILIYSKTYGIASVVVLPRKDIATQSRRPESDIIKCFLDTGLRRYDD